MPKRKHALPKTERGIASYIANVRGGEEREWLSLGDGLALLLEPGPSGAKVFQARFRLKGTGQAKRLTLGYYPQMTLAEARAKLAEVKASVRSGEDPTLEKRRAAAGVGRIETLDQLVEAYLARRADQVSAKTHREETALLRVIQDALGNRRLADIEPRDLHAAVDGYAKAIRKAGGTGTNANKVLAAVRRVFALSRGWGLIALPNPAADLVRPVKEKPRDRILVDGALLIEPAHPKLNEIGLLGAALLDEPSPLPTSRPTRIAILLSLLLGFRAEEVCGLEWKNIRLEDDPTVTITKAKTAAGLRTLPLPPFAVAELRKLRTEADKKAAYVFPAGDGAARRPYLHPESLSRAVARAVERLTMTDFTHHDLRRTCVSGLAELGFEGLAGRIAGHAAQSVTGRHYDHSRRMPAMRTALTAWEQAVVNAVDRHRTSPWSLDQTEAPADNVLPLVRATG